MKNIIASISAGESSGMLAYILRQQQNKGLVNVKYVFMNTGQEDERTLIFADQLDKHFGLNLVWLEAVVDPRKNKGIGHKIVSFETACRDGSVFEAHIAKYGLPSSKAPHCTRDLKGGCCLSWIKTL